MKRFGYEMLVLMYELKALIVQTEMNLQIIVTKWKGNQFQIGSWNASFTVWTRSIDCK